MSRRRPREAPTYVCAKIAYLRGRKSQYSSVFIAYLRQLLKIFAVFLSTYSIFEAWFWEKKNSTKESWWCKWWRKKVNLNLRRLRLGWWWWFRSCSSNSFLRLVASQSTLLRSNKDVLYHVGSTALVPLSPWPIVVTFLAESHYITPWECDILVHNSIFWSRKIAYLRPILGHFGAQT